MNEETLYTARSHPKILFKAGVILLALFVFQLFMLKVWPENISWDFMDRWGSPIIHLMLIVLEVWYVLVPALQWKNTLFTLTNKRVKNDWGVLYKQSREIDLKRIASISEERGILDRVFKCGTLNFYDAAAAAQPSTSGPWNKQQGDSGVRFHDIPNIKEVREMIEQAKYSAVR